MWSDKIGYILFLDIPKDMVEEFAVQPSIIKNLQKSMSKSRRYMHHICLAPGIYAPDWRVVYESVWKVLLLKIDVAKSFMKILKLSSLRQYIEEQRRKTWGVSRKTAYFLLSCRGVLRKTPHFLGIRHGHISHNIVMTRPWQAKKWQEIKEIKVLRCIL